MYGGDEETMITVLLVDDEPLIRQGLLMWLRRIADISVIGEASNGGEAITLAQTLHPDVVLIDMSISATDGIATTAALHASVPRCSVVFLSLHDDAATREQAHAAGAVAFVGKQDGIQTLLVAIREAGGLGSLSPRSEI